MIDSLTVMAMQQVLGLMGELSDDLIEDKDLRKETFPLVSNPWSTMDDKRKYTLQVEIRLQVSDRE